MAGLHGSLFVDCPCCGARLEVDRESGRLLQHWAKREAIKGDLFEGASKKLDEDRRKLDRWFSTAREQMEAKKKQALERFEQERQRIAREGDTSRPPNPMDD